MKHQSLTSTLASALLLCGFAPNATAQGTAFTYQGRLNDGSAPATGLYDFRLQVYNRAVAGELGDELVSGTIVSNAVPVTNGVFALSLDFGAEPFNGEARWLALLVRTNNDLNFTPLLPRQPLASAPYAMRAANLTGTLPAAQLPAAVVTNNASGLNLIGAFTGNGADLTNVNAATLNGVTSAGFWRTSGNTGATGAFLGTTDNLPLELKVNGTRALRMEPHPTSPNVIGGFSGNVVGAGQHGATIGGGGRVGFPNSISASFATIAGGEDTSIQTNAGHAAIGGGYQIRISSGSYASVVGGGFANQIQPNAYSATIGGGELNTIQADGIYATIPGGYFNTATAYAFAAGRQAKANHTGAFVWADSQAADFASTANNQFLIRAAGGMGLGTNNPQATLHIASSIGFPRAQLTLSQLNPSDFARLQLGVTGSPQWTLATGGGATPRLNFYNGTADVAYLQNNGAFHAQSFNVTSDRNAKENVAPVNPREVLEKVARLPINRWNFIGDDATPHVGPMAQDFHAAFGLGTDERHIATVDADGVALAAIQGLNQKLAEREALLRAENAELKQRLAILEELLLPRQKGGTK